VQLEVLAIGDVAHVPAEPLADPADRLDLLRREHPTRDPDPLHEEPVLLRPLRVQAVPAVPHVQVLR
jgi:hypothetical protein